VNTLVPAHGEESRQHVVLLRWLAVGNVEWPEAWVFGGVGGIAEGSRGHTLLHDRDMLLSGNHLGQQLDRSSGIQFVQFPARGISPCRLGCRLMVVVEIWRRRSPRSKEKFQN